MTHKKRLRQASWIVLAIGLAISASIYVLAPAEVADPFNDLSLSKRYLHDLEIYGGRANVIQDEFVRWFEALWHGKKLAITIASITGFTFLVMRFIANPFRLNTPAPQKIPDPSNTDRTSATHIFSDPSHPFAPYSKQPEERKKD